MLRVLNRISISEIDHESCGGHLGVAVKTSWASQLRSESQAAQLRHFAFRLGGARRGRVGSACFWLSADVGMSAFGSPVFACLHPRQYTPVSERRKPGLKNRKTIMIEMIKVVVASRPL